MKDLKHAINFFYRILKNCHFGVKKKSLPAHGFA